MLQQSRQYCTFEVDSLLLGIEVQQVQEVIRRLTMTRVPLAPAAVSGLINLRGQIVTAIDLRRRLGLPDRAEGVVPMNVVVRTGDGAASLQVDEIGDVIEAPADKFEPPPETLCGRDRQLIEGAYKLDDRLMLVLNTREAVEVMNLESSTKPALPQN